MAVNWRVHTKEVRGEIDIIARKDNVLVVCEVKARASADFGDPLEAITERKQFVLRRTAYQFMAANNLSHMKLRCDAASVLGVTVQVLCDVF